MRVLHVLSSSAIGGSQMVVLSLVSALSTYERTTFHSVVLPEGGQCAPRFQGAGIETYSVPIDSPYRASSRLLSILDQCAPDIVHTHGRRAWLQVRHALGTRTKPALVHSFHGFEALGIPVVRRLKLWREDALASRTAAFVCVSESEANDVHEHIRHARGKIDVIQNCIDVRFTKRQARAILPERERAWLDRNASRRLITMVARPEPVKNHDLAFAMADDVLERMAGFAFLFVGFPERGRGFRALKKRHRDAVHAADVLPTAAPAISKSWALLLTSRREGSPLVILEGFALGVPTIGTRVPGITDLVQEGWNGFLIDPLPGALHDLLAKLEGARGLYRAVREGAQKQGGFQNVRAWARQYMDVYRRVGARS